MPTIHTYNPKKVTCVLGPHIVSGFADDSMITIEYAGNGTAVNSGADGEIVRSIDPSEVWNMKLTLQQTSKTNEYLKTVYDVDESTGAGIFPVIIVDLMGSKEFAAPSAWVTKPMGFHRGREQQNCEWEICIAAPKFKFE